MPPSVWRTAGPPVRCAGHATRRSGPAPEHLSRAGSLRDASALRGRGRGAPRLPSSPRGARGEPLGGTPTGSTSIGGWVGIRRRTSCGRARTCCCWSVRASRTRSSLFWDESWSFLGWYVNLQSPLRRSPLGFDMTDWALDVWVEPDGRWQWKDEDDFAASAGTRRARRRDRVGGPGRRRAGHRGPPLADGVGGLEATGGVEAAGAAERVGRRDVAARCRRGRPIRRERSCGARPATMRRGRQLAQEETPSGTQETQWNAGPSRGRHGPRDSRLGARGGRWRWTGWGLRRAEVRGGVRADHRFAPSRDARSSVGRRPARAPRCSPDRRRPLRGHFDDPAPAAAFAVTRTSTNPAPWSRSTTASTSAG